MSPYELKFVDVKYVGRVPGSVTVTLDEGLVQLKNIFQICIYICIILSRMSSF